MAIPISVIIPLAMGEVEWKGLVTQLDLPEGSEVILAAGEQHLRGSNGQLRVVNSRPGRAQQMNAGAKQAANEILWFLHADSRLSDFATDQLQVCLKKNADALYFFDLRFDDDGPKAMKLNEWAVRARAGWLKMPFGDQGFCISKTVFVDSGGYPENVSYGEDHLLVWKTRQNGYPIARVGAEIFTSSRKYRDKGWVRTTLLHVRLTLMQAVPQFLVLIKRRITGFGQ